MLFAAAVWCSAHVDRLNASGTAKQHASNHLHEAYCSHPTHWADWPWLILLQPESLGEGSNKLLIAVIPSQMFVMFVFQVAKPW